MSLRLKCTECLADGSTEARSAAVADGWTFVEIATKSRLKYIVLCATCTKAAKWLPLALGEKPKKAKDD